MRKKKKSRPYIRKGFSYVYVLTKIRTQIEQGYIVCEWSLLGKHLGINTKFDTNRQAALICIFICTIGSF